VTTIVSGFTAAYIHQWSTFFPDRPLELSSLPTFDGRAVQYPNASVLRDYMSWRQVDCKIHSVCISLEDTSTNTELGHINNLYNTTFWTMVLKGGMTNDEAEKELQVLYSYICYIEIRRRTYIFPRERSHPTRTRSSSAASASTTTTNPNSSKRALSYTDSTKFKNQNRIRLQHQQRRKTMNL
jgi:Thg1 C terminal domain